MAKLYRIVLSPLERNYEKILSISVEIVADDYETAIRRVHEEVKEFMEQDNKTTYEWLVAE